MIPSWKLSFEALANEKTALIPDHLMWKAVFLMGPTGAGKSTFAANKWLRFAPKHKNERGWKFQPPESAPSKKERRGPSRYFHVVNPDDFKEEIPGFDRRAPQKVHEVSVDMADAYFDGVLETGEPVVVDGTGAGLKRITMNISLASEAGYSTTLVFLYVPLLVAMVRNAARSRSVPLNVVVNTWSLSKRNFPQLRTQVDKAVAYDMSASTDRALVSKHLEYLEFQAQKFYKKSLLEILQEYDPSGAKQYLNEIVLWLKEPKNNKLKKPERQRKMPLLGY